jgi:hypothetical protein
VVEPLSTVEGKPRTTRLVNLQVTYVCVYIYILLPIYIYTHRYIGRRIGTWLVIYLKFGIELAFKLVSRLPGQQNCVPNYT